MVCSTFTRSRVARTEISISLVTPSHLISPPWSKEQAAYLIASCWHRGKVAGSTSYLILITEEGESGLRSAPHFDYMRTREQAVHRISSWSHRSKVQAAYRITGWVYRSKVAFISAHHISWLSHLIFVAAVAFQLCRIASYLISSSVVAPRIAPTHLVALLEVCREVV
jgi:hypothetical protein